MDDQRVGRESGVTQWKWCEAWVDMGLDPPYVLLVLPSDSGGVLVRDPKTGTVAHQGPDYESVKLWLLEDEYTRVDVRMTEENNPNPAR